MQEDPVQLHDLDVQTLSGERTTLGALVGGKAALVVNVASRCGLTPQYAALEQLHEQLSERGFTVVGVPCNQFLGQEPGSAQEIAQFCSATYGVTFPMLAKTDVNGEHRSPLFAELVKAPYGDAPGGDVLWNFEKWVLSPSGDVVARFRPKVEPDDPAVRAEVEAQLPG